MNSILQELNNQSYLKVTPGDEYTDRLINMAQMIAAEDKKKKLIKNAIIAGVALIFISVLYSKYQEWSAERERLAMEAEKLEAKKKAENERKAKIEEKRKKDNIYRVEHTIFIDNKIRAVKNKLVAALNRESLDTTKETFYINKFTKLFDEEENKLISNIENICTKEAGKETEAIDTCVQNNKNAAAKGFPGIKKDLIAKIKKSILDLKFVERNLKLQKIIDTFSRKLQNENNTLKTYTAQLDSYIINGKNPPSSLEKKIDNTHYNIDNYQHQIKHYKKIMQSDTLEIAEPTNLKKKNEITQTKQKNIYTLKKQEPIKKEVGQTNVVQKPSSTTIPLKIKRLQTKIDSIYIAGGTPSPALLNELKSLKELQKQQ